MTAIRGRRVALGGLALAVPLWSACNSGGGSGGQGLGTAKPPAALCTTLLGIFSDGPDPGADPVGYAMSQIKPLGEMHSAVQSAQPTLAFVHKLISADTALVQSNGSDRSATLTIKKEDAQLNVVCPGVAP